MKIFKEVTLEYCKGRSDKVYKIKILEEDGLFKVRFEYGRWNNVNNIYSKPDNFTSYAEAMTIYEDTLRQKLNKGYVERC